MIELNLQYLQIGIHFQSVIHAMQAEPKPEDEVELMMYQWMMKKLHSKRDSYITQGLNGLNPGYQTGQDNPVAVAKQLLDKALNNDKPSK